MKIYFIWALILAQILLFQNCSQVNFSSVHPESPGLSLSSGNGDGYLGLTINGPSYLKPGEEADIQVSGGVAPYDLISSNPDVSIQAVNTYTGEFHIRLSLGTTSESIELKAFDSSGKVASKIIWIHVLEAKELNGLNNETRQEMAGNLGHIGMTFNDKHAAFIASNTHQLSTSTLRLEISSVFTFNVEDLNNVHYESPILTSSSYGYNFFHVGLSGDFFATVGASLSTSYLEIFKFESTGLKKLQRFTLSNDGLFVDLSMDHDILLAGTSAQRFEIYERNSNDQYVLKQSLSNSSSEGGNFGRYVKINGDSIFATDYNSLSKTNKIYIYRRDVDLWSLQQTINLNQYSKDMNLEYCLPENTFSNGRQLTVGCFTRDASNTPRGYVLIFSRDENNNWNLTQTIFSPENRENSTCGLELIHQSIYSYFKFCESFATKTSLYGDRLAVYSPFESTIYFYRFDQHSLKFNYEKSLSLKGIIYPIHIPNIQLWKNKMLITNADVYKSYAVIVDVDGI
ncbi:MAG: hypothetical protein KDD50_13615 [Bdellovibrionales bacterium]|nr:hypothetical protein [Bdellovibrionales bacterium]